MNFNKKIVNLKIGIKYLEFKKKFPYEYFNIETILGIMGKMHFHNSNDEKLISLDFGSAGEIGYASFYRKELIKKYNLYVCNNDFKQKKLYPKFTILDNKNEYYKRLKQSKKKYRKKLKK